MNSAFLLSSALFWLLAEKSAVYEFCLILSKKYTRRMTVYFLKRTVRNAFREAISSAIRVVGDN
jgi:hypothetical protein